MASVRSILASHIDEISADMSYEAKRKLTARIRAEIKENIGHGVSQEYYNRSPWKHDRFKVTSIVGHIANAANKRGAYSDERLTRQKKTSKRKK